MSASVLRQAFPEASESRDPDKFNMFGLPRISGQKHLRRAIKSGNPHQYISERAGRMEYDGEDGLGFFDAVNLHVKVITNGTLLVPVVPDEDIQKSLGSASFLRAIDHVGFAKLPEVYRSAISSNAGYKAVSRDQGLVASL